MMKTRGDFAKAAKGVCTQYAHIEFRWHFISVCETYLSLTNEMNHHAILFRELLLLLFLLLFSTLCLLEAYAYVERACIIVMWLQIALSNINTS